VQLELSGIDEWENLGAERAADQENDCATTLTLFPTFWIFPFGVNKEVVGIHVLLTRSLFGGGILRRMLPRVSPAKSTSVALRF